MSRKPVIRKGFAGVSNSDFVKKKAAKATETDEELTPEDKHTLFLEKLNGWLRTNCAQLVDTFSRFDQRGSGTVSREEFCDGLQTMKAPFTSSETQLVTSFLTEKPNRAKVDYLAFAKGLHIPFPDPEDFASQKIKLNVRDLSTPECSKCSLKFPPIQTPDTATSHIKLNLELVQFLDKDMPCNFTEQVFSFVTMFGVKELVQHKFGHSLLDVKIYTDKSGSSCPLKHELTLRDIGHKGQREKDPEEVTLYYDVHVNVHVNIDVTHPFYSCPLLLTDHYFARHSPSPPSTAT